MTVQLECFVGNVHLIRVVLYYKRIGLPNFQLFEHTRILMNSDKRGSTVCISKKSSMCAYEHLCTYVCMYVCMYM